VSNGPRVTAGNRSSFSTRHHAKRRSQMSSALVETGAAFLRIRIHQSLRFDAHCHNHPPRTSLSWIHHSRPRLRKTDRRGAFLLCEHTSNRTADASEDAPELLAACARAGLWSSHCESRVLCLTHRPTVSRFSCIRMCGIRNHGPC
jgi:hypothetical protein